MSRENVDLVRRAYAAWNRGDMDEMIAILHPDFVYVPSGLFPGIAPVYRGPDGWRDFWRDFRGPWESLRIVEDELRDAGKRILTFFTFHGRGRDGVAVRRLAANVWSFRDGLVVRIEAYASWPEALEAVGLSE